MFPLAKTAELVAPASDEIKSTFPAKPVYYIPLKTRLKIADKPTVIPLSFTQDIPIEKWTMPVQPEGYLIARQHDIF